MTVGGSDSLSLYRQGDQSVSELQVKLDELIIKASDQVKKKQFAEAKQSYNELRNLFVDSPLDEERKILFHDRIKRLFHLIKLAILEDEARKRLQ